MKRAKPYEDVSLAEWSTWTWQLQNTLSTTDDFSSLYVLNDDQKLGLQQSGVAFKVATTPYYASLALNEKPIQRIFIPEGKEATPGKQQMNDPLAEEEHSPTARIIHRYSDRVLFLITDTCSVYCRFCTRKRFTGQDEGLANRKDYQEALKYIREHPGIREVIFSGGDPLTLSNSVLDRVLSDVRQIPHIEIIRIGSRMPVVCPMRIDETLAKIFRKHAPVFVMSHFSHPKELTEEAARALSYLVDNGVPVFNQMVLLNGVNNHASIVQALSRRLLYLRVKPYYMFQCDPSLGTDHLRTTVESSEEIVMDLWGHLSGLAMPTLSLDIPSGGGKTTLAPHFMISRGNGLREYKGWDGRVGVYKNPEVDQILPEDVTEYIPEWDALRKAKKEKSAPVEMDMAQL